MLGCLKGLHFGPTQVVDLTNKVKALTNRNRPIDSNQVFIGCDRHCERSPCVGESICIEHWAYRRCWCRNPIAQLGFNCELNLNSNAVTMISEQPHIHFTLPRHFGAFRRNHLREFDHERVRVLELLRMFNVRDVYESEGAAAEMVVTTTESSLERFVNRSLWTMMDDNVINKEIINSIDQPEMTRSFNSTMATTPKISSLPSRLIRAPESLGPLRMMVQLAIRSRVSDGLLLYANDNCNNFVQFHLVDASRICATINVGQHLIRAEIHVPSNLFKNGSLIQIRLRRYDQVSVFTVAHATSAGKWIQRVLVLIIPLQFLDSYSHRPFRTSAKFSAVAILEIKQIEQVIDLRADLIDSSFDSSNRTRIGAAEQVIPLRRHMKVQMSEEALLNGDAQQELQIAWPQSIVCNDSNDCDSTEHERVYLQHLNSLAKGRNVTLQTLADMLQLPSIVSSTFNVTVGALSDTTPNVTKTNGNVTQVFLGNVDGQNILSTLPGFRGCVSGLVINNKNVNLTKIVELRNKDEVQAGHFLLDCRMLCDIANCQNNGKKANRDERSLLKLI